MQCTIKSGGLQYWSLVETMSSCKLSFIAPENKEARARSHNKSPWHIKRFHGLSGVQYTIVDVLAAREWNEPVKRS